MHASLDPAPSRALFSLATGLEVATGQATLEAVGRAKQAAILFDEVIIESGLHLVEVTTAGLPTIQRFATHAISPILLKDSRTVERGTKTGIAVREADGYVELLVGTDLPRFTDATYFEHEIQYRYVSEYHTGLLDQLARLDVEWARVISIRRGAGDPPETNHEALEPLKTTDQAGDTCRVYRLSPDAARDLALQLQQEVEETTEGSQGDDEDVNASRDRMLAEDLAEAVKVAADLDAVPAVSTAFAGVANERGVPVGLPGAESLGFLVPNFSVLPWEAIAEFRDHPGAMEARARLREFEAEAAAREAQGSTDYVRATARDVTKGLLATVKDLAPSLPEDLRSPIAGSTIGFIPIVGQYASLAISMGDMIAALRQHQAFEGSWVAAVFELRDAAVDSLVDW